MVHALGTRGPWPYQDDDDGPACLRNFLPMHCWKPQDDDDDDDDGPACLRNFLPIHCWKPQDEDAYAMRQTLAGISPHFATYCYMRQTLAGI